MYTLDQRTFTPWAFHLETEKHKPGVLSEIGSWLTEKYVNKRTFRTREQTSRPHYFLTCKTATEMPTREIFLAMPRNVMQLKAGWSVWEFCEHLRTKHPRPQLICALFYGREFCQGRHICHFFCPSFRASHLHLSPKTNGDLAFCRGPCNVVILLKFTLLNIFHLLRRIVHWFLFGISNFGKNFLNLNLFFSFLFIYWARRLPVRDFLGLFFFFRLVSLVSRYSFSGMRFEDCLSY